MQRGRWAKVEQFEADLLAGDEFPPPVLLHPSITGRSDGLLLPIDGARRLMAHLEAGIHEVTVIVVCAEGAFPRTTSSERVSVTKRGA